MKEKRLGAQRRRIDWIGGSGRRGITTALLGEWIRPETSVQLCYSQIGIPLIAVW